MSHLSQREAAKVWGVSRITLQRYIKNGKLSLTIEKRIDSAELVRVFGEPGAGSNGPVYAIGEPEQEPSEINRLKALEMENAALKAVLTEKDARLADKDSHLADLRAEVARLIYEKPPESNPLHHRWWRRK